MSWAALLALGRSQHQAQCDINLSPSPLLKHYPVYHSSQRHHGWPMRIVSNEPQNHARRCLNPCVTTTSRRDQMDIGTIMMLSVLFSAIGAGYFLYGKKQHQWVLLLAGIALCV